MITKLIPSLPQARRALLALTLGAAASTAAWADGDRCQAGPERDWRPMAELVGQLNQQGWWLRKVEIDDGCYEVEAVDREGRYHDVRFHPKTLERVGRGV